jgi:hypothetical protein
VTELARIDEQHPWPWLDPFTERASRFFNGRDDDAQALVRGVLATPACLLFGKSGLGKTSLLLAGLFPPLRGKNHLPVFLRIEHGAGATGLSSQLLRSLADAVHDAQLHWEGTASDQAGDGDDVASLWERLHDRRQQLLDAVGRRWIIVFVLDQFEEVFTLQQDEQRRRQTFEELGDLVENRVPPSVAARLDEHDELVDHIDPDSQGYRFLLSLREDFLPELEAWADLIPRLGPNRYRLLPMSREQALEAVEKTGGPLVDPDAAGCIVDFLGRQSAPAGGARVVREERHIEPALLSLVCASLNADRLAQTPPAGRLDVSDLEARGAKILDRFYDDAFAAVPDAQRAQAARWVESDLITAGGTRRPYPIAAIDEALWPALRPLVDRRLLRIENTEQGAEVELVHDRLASIALQRAQVAQQRAEVAERLRREKEVAELELLKERARAAGLAEDRVNLERNRAEDARRASQYARRLVTVLTVVAVSALGLAAFALYQRREAMVARERAEAAKKAAEEKVAVATQATNATVTALAAATQAAEAANLLRSNQPDRSFKANELLSSANQAYKTASEDFRQLQACPVGRRIYPQVGEEADKAAAEKLAPALGAAGFIVPPVEVVGRRNMPTKTEVRYFRKDEKSGALAATAALAQAGLPGVLAKYFPGYEDSTSIRPCHYELWFVPDGGTP